MWTVNQGEVRQLELFWSEDERYQKLVTYGADGEVVNEVVISES